MVSTGHEIVEPPRKALINENRELPDVLRLWRIEPIVRHDEPDSLRAKNVQLTNSRER